MGINPSALGIQCPMRSIAAADQHRVLPPSNTPPTAAAFDHWTFLDRMAYGMTLRGIAAAAGCKCIPWRSLSRHVTNLPSLPDPGGCLTSLRRIIFTAQSNTAPLSSQPTSFAPQAQGKAPLSVPDGKEPWYYERLGFRSLRKPLSEDQLVALTKSVMTMRDQPYEKESGEMVNAAVDCCECCCHCTANQQERRESLFCSEFVAALYIDAGLLPPKPPAGEYVPSDFSRDHGCNLSSLLCCCWASWVCGRCCGVGDMRSHADHGTKLFGPPMLLQTPIPPRSSQT